jgi:CRP/FNR family cyclic AMP-dependent transcriptional regulator
LRVTFADALSASAREELVACGRRIDLPAGVVVLREGDSGDRVLLISSGHVKLTKAARSGVEVVLDFRGPGDVLGEQAVLGNSDRSATVESLTAVSMVSVPARDFRAWLGRTPDAMFALLGTLDRRLREADRQRLEFGSAQTLARVAARLLDLAQRFGRTTDEGTVIELAIAQDELAAWSGASREATVKALRSLRSLGLVMTSRRRIVVHDLDAIARHAA